MNKKIYIPIFGLCLVIVSALNLSGSEATFAQQQAHPKSSRAVCSKPQPLSASCHSHIVTDAGTNVPLATSSYTDGYKPSDIQSAYSFPTTPIVGSNFSPNGQTVAIVDAYDNPNTASDLVAYRQNFNLPLCSTTNPSPTADDLTNCFFTKLNQTGATSPLPAGNVSWGQEINLDVQAVSGACPSCKILLVEASSSSYTDLGTAVNTAAALGANAISNSYGGAEFRNETLATYSAPYNHPGIAITVSSGDSGYGVQFPAASSYVTSVGGTSLSRNTSTAGWAESAWKGTGSGCSAYISKAAYQPSIGSCTSKRIVADVSAVADPNTGIAMYDSYGSTANQNWYVIGGTSLASPIIASAYALAGNAGGVSPAIKYSEYPYTHASGLTDITTGTNGICTARNRTADYALCSAVAGFDGPTGTGAPNGLFAF